MKQNKIYCMDSLEFLKEQKDYSIDINYSDPPYALGSEVIIKTDGKVDYKKASDFMNKWDMPTGIYWEEWFKEAYRTLKYGSYCIMFGMDRQLLLFKYYASLAGFSENQSLYWYFISSFPKSSDLSKNLDKNAGAEREITKQATEKYRINDISPFDQRSSSSSSRERRDIPSTPLAKKYSGYKYSISPTKQTNETIMIFQKPYKTGSCLHDVLAYENGNKECCCGALNIDGGRCDFQSESDRKESTLKNQHKKFGTKPMTGNNCYGDYSMMKPKNFNPSGRYPAQTFINSEAGAYLDKQSGIKKGSDAIRHNNQSKNTGAENGAVCYGKYQDKDTKGFADIGGCSKILHKCDFEKNEHDLYIYCPKVSKSERNKGCERMEKRECKTGIDTEGRTNNDLMERFRKEPQTNNHPTLKPIKLNERILKLFKTPIKQNIIFPFAGSGSEIIGSIRVGFKEWSGCELNPEYITIANARIKKELEQKRLF